MKIRPAHEKDIPFIIKGILEIEKINKNDNTYNRLFGTDTVKTIDYLTKIFEDEENIGTEISLDTFIIAEIEGVPAGFCCLIHTDKNYYLNKGEIFAIHLENKDLQHFTQKASVLPNHRKYSENKYFIEYIFTHEDFRRRGVAEKMIEYQTLKTSSHSIHINVFENKPETIRYYKKLGYKEQIKTPIDTHTNSIYPSKHKIILMKKKD